MVKMGETVIKIDGKVLRTPKDRQQFIRNTETGNYEGSTLTGDDVRVTLIQGVGYELEVSNHNGGLVYEGYNAKGSRDS